MWQPIETAPKNGDDFLACMWNTTSLLVICYDEHADDPKYPWTTLDGPNYALDAPTHWMPLPAAPQSK